MAKEWHQLTDEELAEHPEAREAKRQAYCASFYDTQEARQVLYDLTGICFRADENQVALLTRIRLLGAIKANCGYTNESQMAAIEAESKHNQGE